MDAGDRAHLVIEAVKIGLRDRDDHLTDPDAHDDRRRPTSTPTTWIARAPRRDRPGSGAACPRPGHPQRGGTAYLCAADGDGLLVSLIQSNFLALRLRACTCPSGGST